MLGFFFLILLFLTLLFCMLLICMSLDSTGACIVDSQQAMTVSPGVCFVSMVFGTKVSQLHEQPLNLSKQKNCRSSKACVGVTDIFLWSIYAFAVCPVLLTTEFILEFLTFTI